MMAPPNSKPRSRKRKGKKKGKGQQQQTEEEHTLITSLGGSTTNTHFSSPLAAIATALLPSAPPLPRSLASPHASAMANDEVTFIMIKPDGVQRGLIGDIICRFEKKGFFLKAMKMIQVERSFAEKHYSDLSTKPFFGSLVEYIVSGPVVAMVWQGKGVVATGRKIIGATNPAASEPGTIRGDYCIEVSRNVIHGSDAVESARKEIALWFPDGIVDWRSASHPWIYEN